MPLSCHAEPDRQRKVLNDLLNHDLPFSLPQGQLRQGGSACVTRCLHDHRGQAFSARGFFKVSSLRLSSRLLCSRGSSGSERPGSERPFSRSRQETLCLSRWSSPVHLADMEVSTSPRWRICHRLILHGFFVGQEGNQCDLLSALSTHPRDARQWGCRPQISLSSGGTLRTLPISSLAPATS